MQFTAAQIAGLLNGQIEGDPKASVSKLAKIEEGVPGSISFLANPLYTQFLYTSQASIIIINMRITQLFTIYCTLRSRFEISIFLVYVFLVLLYLH